jgi:hypothetical protein
MFKKLVLTLAAGAALTAASTTAFANGSFAFDDPYWKQQLDRSSEPSVFALFAAGPRDTMTDAIVEFRATDAGIAAANEAEKSRLDSAGFPQYLN